MRTAAAILLAVPAFLAGEAKFDVAGQVLPEAEAAVHLHGAVTPFSASTLADPRGRFQFRDVIAGTYTLSVFIPNRGEWRRTIEVGQSLADARGRVAVRVEMDEAKLETRDSRRQTMVSARELSIPERARKEYSEAQKKLSRRDVPAAIKHLERAVELAPQFSAAWNNLGTIAYQSRRFPDAERYFRESLAQDGSAFEPLVNLGGVLLTMGQLDEALQFNLNAVLSRSNDALANSQLGMTYFALNRLQLAEKYLLAAKRLDPAHFSHPQLTLADLYVRRNQRAEAAAELEDFLHRHPDSPQAARLRPAIEKLRKGLN